MKQIKSTWCLYQNDSTGLITRTKENNSTQTYTELSKDYSFDAVMIFNGSYGKHDSGWGFYFKDTVTGFRHPMFGSDVEKLIKSGSIVNVVVVGSWNFRNSGGTLGIQFNGK